MVLFKAAVTSDFILINVYSENSCYRCGFRDEPCGMRVTEQQLRYVHIQYDTSYIAAKWPLSLMIPCLKQVNSKFREASTAVVTQRPRLRMPGRHKICPWSDSSPRPLRDAGSNRVQTPNACAARPAGQLYSWCI